MNLSEALAEFEPHLVDIRKACVENVLYAQKTPNKELDIDGEWTKENIHSHVEYLLVQERTTPLIRVIKRIDSRKQHHTSGRITDADIERAKEYPIEELYEGRLFGKKRKCGLCPFHDESTPSFYIFPDNKFKCFGCQAHGSAIDFVMMRDGVNFITAVKSMIQ